MNVDDLYKHITSVMTPEEALKKLLSSSLLSYEKLKFDSEQEKVHPELIIVFAAMDLGWHVAVEKAESSENVRGLAVGTQEYMDSLFDGKNSHEKT